MAQKVHEVFDRRQDRGLKPFPRWDSTEAGRKFKMLKEQIGIKEKDLCLHAMRHSCVTRSLELGADSMEVQEFVGHASPVTTRGYLHLTSRHLKKCSSLFDQMGA